MKNIKLMLTAFAAVLMSMTAFAQAPQKGADRANKMVERMTEELGLSDVQIEQIRVIQNEFTEKIRTMRGEANNGDRTAIREEMRKVATEREASISDVLTETQREKWTTVKTERPGMGERPVKRPNVERPVVKDGDKRPVVKGERPTIDSGKRPTVKGERPTIDSGKRPTVKGERPTIDSGKRPAVKGERPTMDSGKRPAVKGEGKRPAMNSGKRPPREMSGDKLKKALGLSDTQATELKKLTKAHHAQIKELKADGKTRKIKRVTKKYRAAVENLLTPEQFKKWTSIKAERGTRRGVIY